MPYEAIRDGQHVGIASDYLTLFKKYTDYDFELIPTETWDETIELLKSGDCQLTLIVNKTEERSQYLSFSDIFFRSLNVLVSDSKQPFLQDLSHVGDRTVATIGWYRNREYLDKFYPDIKQINVNSELEGIEAVANGDADLFIGSMLSLNLRIQERGLQNLKVSGWGGPEDELRVGVIHPMKHILPDINRAIADISEEERLNIVRKWNNVQVIEKFDYRAYYAELLILFAVLAFLGYRQRQLKRFNATLHEKNAALKALHRQLEATNKELEQLSFHDALTGLYNRRYFCRVIEDELKALQRSKEPSCLMLVDIDFFKEINDRLGHQTGDETLVALANIFHAVVRDADVSARWGGEEFIVALPRTQLDEGVTVANRLLTRVRHHDFNGHSITVSIGIAQYREGETFDAWFERVDTALYQAKSNGRNQLQLG